jgi:hypothetical protein
VSNSAVRLCECAGATFSWTYTNKWGLNGLNYLKGNGTCHECAVSKECDLGKVCESGTCVASPVCASPCGPHEVCENGVCLCQYGKGLSDCEYCADDWEADGYESLQECLEDMFCNFCHECTNEKRAHCGAY